MSYWIHQFHYSQERGEDLQAVWEYYRRHSIVTFGYGDDLDEGRRRMLKYSYGDILFVYAVGKGVVGSARVHDPSTYRIVDRELLPADAANNHRHIMIVAYTAWTEDVEQAVPPSELRRILGISDAHLRTLPCPLDDPAFHTQEFERELLARWKTLPALPPVTSIEEGDGRPEQTAHVVAVTVNRYERDATKRAACLRHYGSVMCQCCGDVLTQKYGPQAEGLLQVHHRKPISDLGSDVAVDPVRDLLPVCPNCHYMIHSRIPCMTVEEVQALLEANQAR